MVIILKQNQEKAKVDELIHWLENFQVQVNVVNGSHTTILGLIGDTSKIDIENVAAKDVVESVKRVQEPYKNANR